MQVLNGEDLFIWPDGTMCYREELEEMGHMSDDFEVAPVDTPRWVQLINDQEV